MKRFFHWSAIILGSLIGLILVAYAALYVISERVLHRQYEIPKVSLAVPTDQQSIDEGKRLATIRGCVGGCHGKDAEGQVMFNAPAVARIMAPNLTAAVRNYSDAELVVAIRNGIRPDGRSMLIMPSESFISLTDADVGKIIAYLKSLPPAPGPDASVALGPLGRLGLASGNFKMVAQLIAETVPPPEASGDEQKMGRYLAQTACAGCHAGSLRGASNPKFTSPDLAIVAAYSPEAFTRLLRTGVALGERKLGMMSTEARGRLTHLNDTEIAALHSYLRALPPVAAK